MHDNGRLQRGGFFDFNAMIESAVRNTHGFVQADYLFRIFARAEDKLLTVSVTNGRMRFHDNSGLGPICSRRERAFGAHDQPNANLERVLAEIPDVAFMILREPIERIFY